jgi:hypothetical protein
MKIKEIILFAYATKGEALQGANEATEDLCVASIVITRGLKPAEFPVAYVVLRESFVEDVDR